MSYFVEVMLSAFHFLYSMSFC